MFDINMSNSNSRVLESPETERGDDSNFELPEDYLMSDGWLEDYQPAVINSGFTGNPVNQENTVNETGGISSLHEGPNNRESEGRRVEGKVRERLAFRTRSEVEVLEDGYKWRKYGKKKVKNSPNPRKYYGCSVEGCPVKKRVERDREDPSYVITTYEGVHNHNSPQCLMFPQVPTATTKVTIVNPSDSRKMVEQFNGQQLESDITEELGMPVYIETKDESLFSVERCTNMSSSQGGVLTEIPEGDEWIAPNICAIVCKPVLPESPNCPFLVALSLEGSKALMAIPSSFFEHMPVLTRLNLSHTSIRSLPVSLFKLVSLKELSLRHCKLFMELSPQVGQLYNLVLLDLDETQIAELPKEIGKLSNLEILRLSLDGYMNCGKQSQENVLIHPGTIKRLSQLMELKIDVNPENDDWNAVEEVVVEEICSLERLKCLILYLPNIQILGKRRTGGSSLDYYPLWRFRFTVGQHRQRIISRVPKKVEAHFQEWDKCLKFVKGNDISSGMKRVAGYTQAFYLECHFTARSLCDFGIENIEKLEFCLLAECNEIQTIIDGEKPYEEEQINMVEDEATNYESKGGSFSSQQLILLNLQYLYIYYLKNLVSIWRTPTYDKRCLSGLKVLELHVCPKLSVIFTLALLTSLGKLEVLVVEDCPELTSVVSPTSNASFKSAKDCFLPSLKMVLLLFLPKLESISSDFLIAPKLEKIGFYDCPELKGLSKREMSSKNLTLIKGEREWWEALEWDESDWECRPDYLHSIFSPIDEDDDVMTQMEEMCESFKQYNKNGHSKPWIQMQKHDIGAVGCSDLRLSHRGGAEFKSLNLADSLFSVKQCLTLQLACLWKLWDLSLLLDIEGIFLRDVS
ncbi:hypothetical protein SLEP1_g34092 [Rubroshorea leprosula]|uniref:WRKY domain-containing protein n=1 Tax=Rubroshorea leprosula TaxID=152421 RepID=A0AAV5KIT7_9ROSI|nr:hypothetical protein SLEP1_g34092 [Rubroshorea leprosula]